MTSAIPGFHRLAHPEQLGLISEFYGKDMDHNIRKELLSRDIVFGHNFRINGQDCFVPMKTEERGIYRAVYGAKLMRNGNGIEAFVDNSYPKALGQAYFIGNCDEIDMEYIDSLKNEILQRANHGHMHSRTYDIKTALLPGGMVLNLLIDPGEASGMALASRMTETIAPYVSGIGAIYDPNLPRAFVGNICSNSAGRLVHVRGEVPISNLGITSKKTGRSWSGKQIAERINYLQNWAYNDPQRAVTHNKGFMNGVLAVGLPLCQDLRALDAAAYFYVTRDGKMKPLSQWKIENDKLVGHAAIPIPCGIVGGEIDPFAKELLSYLNINSADSLAMMMASTGLVSNLTALNMLSSIGVIEGNR